MQRLEENAVDTNEVDVSVSEGIVTLKGEAKTKEERLRVEAFAKSTDRVIEVRNELTVKPDSGLAHAVSVIASEVQKLATPNEEKQNEKDAHNNSNRKE